MLINYRIRAAARESNNSTNVVIASFTTSYARMELYKYMDMLGSERLFYWDTDSIVFSGKPGQIMPEKGVFLGQMTDELKKYGPDSTITEYVSGGPKNYAMKIYSPTKGEIKPIVKVKGITLNYNNSKLINFDSMRKLVCAREYDHENIPSGSDNSISGKMGTLCVLMWF